MMLTRLAVGLEPLNALDAAHRSPRSAPHSRTEFGSPVGPATRRSIKRNKELAKCLTGKCGSQVSRSLPAVADGVNVNYDVYKIDTEITKGGGRVEKGFYVDKHDRLTRKVGWEQLDEDLAYAPNELDRAIANSQRMRSTTRGLLPKFKQNATALRD
jgi:hypothetical protein